MRNETYNQDGAMIYCFDSETFQIFENGDWRAMDEFEHAQADAMNAQQAQQDQQQQALDATKAFLDSIPALQARMKQIQANGSTSQVNKDIAEALENVATVLLPFLAAQFPNYYQGTPPAGE